MDGVALAVCDTVFGAALPAVATTTAAAAAAAASFVLSFFSVLIVWM